MPYSQLAPTILYPNISTDVWVVISRLSETPVRVVPSVKLVNHASEFALPFPTGNLPSKDDVITFDRQMTDDLGRPLYDDETTEGTALDIDMSGNALPPKMETTTETRSITLRDYPERFTLQEIFQAVVKDFLKAFPFYNYGYIFVFDDRFDSISVYQDQQKISGFASGGHPIFMGPLQFKLDTSMDPRGHLLLIAPEVPGVNWYFQTRHGVAGVNGQTGPILDIEQASRLGEIFYMYPMENLPMTQAMMTDAGNIETTHGWIRTGANGRQMIQNPVPIIPFIMILGRSTGSTNLNASF